VTSGYSGKPVPEKLGIKDGHLVLLADAPDGFALEPMPGGVTLHARTADSLPDGPEPYDLVLAFCPDRPALEKRFAPLAGRITTAGALWIAWPKKAGGMASDLDENVVRDVGLAVGLVDVKVIAVDSVWSGLKFVRRLRDRGEGAPSDVSAGKG
jgi:hypothetical protein